jgi:hypothetical protein
MSHETIYRSLFTQARGALKRELLEHLRRISPPVSVVKPSANPPMLGDELLAFRGAMQHA